MKPELARLEEMFYTTSGVSSADALLAYTNQALQVFINAGLHDPHIISFPGRGVPDSLQVLVAQGLHPHVAGIRIEQKTPGLHDLLNCLSGSLIACYPCCGKPFGLGRLDEMASQVPMLRYHERDGALVRLELPALSLRAGTVSEQLGQVPPDVQDLVLDAGSLCVRGDFYREDNPCDTLVHVCCVIRNRRPAYHFSYECRTANLEILPGSMIPVLERIFALVCKNFSQLALHRYSISSLRRSA